MGNTTKIVRGAVVWLLLLGCLPELRAQELTPAAPQRRWPSLFEVSADYVFLFYTPSQFVGLSTTGSIGDSTPGGIGQPSTRFLNNDTPDPLRPAVQGTLTWWLADPEAVSL